MSRFIFGLDNDYDGGGGGDDDDVDVDDDDDDSGGGGDAWRWVYYTPELWNILAQLVCAYYLQVCCSVTAAV